MKKNEAGMNLKFQKYNWSQVAVWPDLAKFCHFFEMLLIFGNFLEVHSVFCKIMNLIWQILCANGQKFIVVNGQILKE